MATAWTEKKHGHFLYRTLPGDTIEEMRPAGLFVLRSADGPIIAFAGGSGITPVISIIKTALVTTTRPIVLVYANRSADAVIFADELERLRGDADGRLHVHRVGSLLLLLCAFLRDVSLHARRAIGDVGHVRGLRRLEDGKITDS